MAGARTKNSGADGVKAKAAIMWVGLPDGVQAAVRRYDRLLDDAQPDASGKDFLTLKNPGSLKVVTTYVEPLPVATKPDQRFQFGRNGYFVADRTDHNVGGKVMFNRVTRLKVGWER